MWEAIENRDLDRWASYVDVKCIFTDDEGGMISKAELMSHSRAMPPDYDRSEDHREFTVRVYGNTGVLNFRLTAHERFTDADIITEMRQTETFVKQSGSWKLIAAQWSALPVNFLIPAAGNPEDLRDYAGQYEWRPGGPVDHVFTSNGKLWSRLNEERDDHEYLPLGKDAFFLRDDLGKTRFIRNLQNRVIGYIYLRADGQEIHVKRIN
jgi:hypothetical protein